MISTINEIVENLNNYTKINRKLVKHLGVLDEKIRTITKYEGTYDLGLSHTNLEFKKDLLELQLEYRMQNLKCCLTKIYSDVGGIYTDVNILFKKMRSVLKDQKTRLPEIPKIILSEKNKTIDIKDFSKWLKSVEQLLETTRGKIRMLNEKRDAFETMIRNELPSIDLRQTMNLQKEDLLNEYDRIRHKFVSIINFNYYVTKHILQYNIYEWTNQDKILERNVVSPKKRRPNITHKREDTYIERKRKKKKRPSIILHQVKETIDIKEQIKEEKEEIKEEKEEITPEEKEEITPDEEKELSAKIMRLIDNSGLNETNEIIICEDVSG